MLFRASVVAVSALMVMPLPAAGQLIEGARVRVTIDGTLADDGSVKRGAPQSVVARFTGMEPGHLKLAVDDARTIRVPKGSVTRLEVRRRSRARGALLGAGAGTGVGLVLGAIAASRCEARVGPTTCAASTFSFQWCSDFRSARSPASRSGSHGGSACRRRPLR